MESQKLNQLLEQYWEGKLSEEEENQLKTALIAQEPTLEGELKDAAAWFKSTDSFKDSISPSANFESKVMDQIQGKVKPKENWSWLKIAAAILVMLTIGYTAWRMPQSTENGLAGNTAENPERAFEETKATLALMASLMNNGKSQLESLELFQKAQDKIRNQPKAEDNKKDENS